MKKIKAKTCKECRAFNNSRCVLGYKIKTEPIFYGISSRGKPLEPCPKPKTYDEYIKALKEHSIIK